MEQMTRFWDRVRELDSSFPFALPALIAIIATVISVFEGLSAPGPETTYEKEDVLGMALVVAQAIPILFFRRAPLATLVVIMVAFAIHASFNYDLLWIVQFTVMLAMFAAASTRDDRQSIIAGVFVFFVIVIVFGFMREDNDSADVPILLILFGGLWILANIVRSRRMRIASVEQIVVELEEEQDRVAHESAAQERARIARELHDVVGHTLNLMVIQAGAAQRVFQSSPEKALETVKSIETTGRNALSDMDRMLDILEPSDEEVGDGALTPRPSLARLDALLNEVREAGVPVESAVEGNPETLAPSVDLSAYRVIQESLTNVIKHAPGAETKVLLRYTPGLVEIEILNEPSPVTGTTPSVTRTGRGIVGMRERVAVFDGKFSAGPTPDRGFHVTASLPTQPRVRA